MPWKERNAVDERNTFVLECLRDKERFTELCEQYEISRKTGYKWLQRFHEGGPPALLDRSRRPHRIASMVSEAVAEQVVALRKKHPTWGPKKLRGELIRVAPETHWPALSTIGSLLKRRGLIPERKRRIRTPYKTQPLAAATAPNTVWTADFKGAYRVAGRYCHPLTIMDAHSRYLLKVHPLEKESFKLVQPVFEQVFREYGMPYRIRTDNGSPFASTKAVGGLSKLSVWWIRLGILPERIEPGHPEQNGRHERMHRTLKAEAVHPGRTREGEQETLLETFRKHYNDERPHEALKQCTPASVHVLSTIPYPERLPDPEYPREFALRRAGPSGQIKFNRTSICLGSVLGRQEIGLETISDGKWQVWFGPIYLGHMIDGGRGNAIFRKNLPMDVSE